MIVLALGSRVYGPGDDDLNDFYDPDNYEDDDDYWDDEDAYRDDDEDFT